MALPQPSKISAIATGADHLLVLTTTGTIYTWGAGEQSQLGRKVVSRRKITGTVPAAIALGKGKGKHAVIIRLWRISLLCGRRRGRRLGLGAKQLRADWDRRARA
jgi:alpha-tubulin suppressor-like RCC1 family protein